MEQIKLSDFAPHLLRFDLVQDQSHFSHNIERDLGIFILWENGRKNEDLVTSYLRNSFSIIYGAEIEWSDDNIFRNFSRLYDKPGVDKAKKAKNVGSGPFLVYIVWDKNPIYVYDRSVSGDVEITNARVASAKRELRTLVPGKFLIHSSNSIREFFEQGSLLIGPKKLEIIFKQYEWDNKFHKLKQDLMGCDGWKDFYDLFSVLNYSSDYTLLRNFESLFSDQGDIDLLCSRLSRFESAANARPRGNSVNPSKVMITVAGRDIPVDARFVGDGYYDALWQKDILARKVLYRSGFYVPRADDYFFSLLYHAKIQKLGLKDEYLKLLPEIAKSIGISWMDDKSIVDDQRAASILWGYMSVNSYKYEVPSDKNVLSNEGFLKCFAQAQNGLPAKPGLGTQDSKAAPQVRRGPPKSSKTMKSVNLPRRSYMRTILGKLIPR